MRDDDAAADDGAPVTLEDFALLDHERALVDAGAQVHDRREPHDVGRGRAGEREDHRDCRDGADPAELAAVLGVAEP